MQKTPDFQLEAKTMMYHFCLIEDSGAAKVSTLPASSGSSIGSAVNSSNQNQSEILNNLLHVFLSSSDAKVLNIHILRNHFQGKIGVKDIQGVLCLRCFLRLWKNNRVSRKRCKRRSDLVLNGQIRVPK